MTDSDLEHRLRRALAARAAAVTSQDLRPAADPSRADRRGPVSRWWLPLSAGVAAAAVSIAAFVVLRPSEPAPLPVMPGSARSADPSPTTSPAPSATSSQAGPIPSASKPPTPTSTVPPRPASSPH